MPGTPLTSPRAQPAYIRHHRDSMAFRTAAYRLNTSTHAIFASIMVNAVSAIKEGLQEFLYFSLEHGAPRDPNAVHRALRSGRMPDLLGAAGGEGLTLTHKITVRSLESERGRKHGGPFEFTEGQAAKFVNEIRNYLVHKNANYRVHPSEAAFAIQTAELLLARVWAVTKVSPAKTELPGSTAAQAVISTKSTSPTDESSAPSENGALVPGTMPIPQPPEGEDDDEDDAALAGALDGSEPLESDIVEVADIVTLGSSPRRDIFTWLLVLIVLLIGVVVGALVVLLLTGGWTTLPWING